MCGRFAKTKIYVNGRSKEQPVDSWEAATCTHPLRSFKNLICSGRISFFFLLFVAVELLEQLKGKKKSELFVSFCGYGCIFLCNKGKGPCSFLRFIILPIGDGEQVVNGLVIVHCCWLLDEGTSCCFFWL